MYSDFISLFRSNIFHPPSRYRSKDLIVDGIKFYFDFCGNTMFGTDVPLLETDVLDIPQRLIRFSKYKGDSDCCVYFYEHDYRFVNVLKHPLEVLEIIRNANCVIGPDFSQYADMNKDSRLFNSRLNKVITYFWLKNGVKVIPNVTWSCGDSLDYCFNGFEKKKLIAINSMGVRNNKYSSYLWQRGYKEAVRILEPTAILRYGPRMEDEHTEISKYFNNPQIELLRNGSKR